MFNCMVIMVSYLGCKPLLFASVIFYMFPGYTGQTATYTNETALRTSLQTGYDRFSRPYSPTTVNYMYNIRSLKALDITAQMMDHMGWFFMTWQDPRISWDPNAYNNLTYIYVNWAWRPEISVINGGNLQFGLDNDDTRLTVFHDGTVIWTPVVAGSTACKVNVLNFPFDKQTCDIYVMFWGMETNRDIIVNITSTNIGTQEYLLNGEWDLISSGVFSSTFQSCCPATQQTFLTMQLTFVRLHPYFVINLLIPAILLSVCMTWSFYLPTESGERIGYCLTILLSYTVLLTITSAMVPTTSTEIPHLGLYLLMILVFCTIAVCNVAINVKLHSLEEEPGQGFQKFYRLMYPIVYCTLCCKKKATKVEAIASPTPENGVRLVMEDFDYTKQKPADDTQDEPESIKAAPPVTWTMISELLDRLCFWIYNMAIFIANLVLIVVLATS